MSWCEGRNLKDLNNGCNCVRYLRAVFVVLFSFVHLHIRLEYCEAFVISKSEFYKSKINNNKTHKIIFLTFNFRIGT